MPQAKHLSRTVIDALRPAAVRYEQPDLGERGLYLVVQPSGHKSWAFRFRSEGRPRKLTLGEYPAFGVEEARSRAREAKIAAKRGEDPASAKIEARAERKAAREADIDTFAGVARLFLRRYAMPKNRSWREQGRLLGLAPDPEKPETRDDPRAFLAVAGGPAAKLSKKPFRALRNRDVRAVIDDIVDRGSPGSANRTLAVMHRLFEWATTRDDLGLADNLAAKIEKQPEQSRDRLLSLEEIRLLWKACEAIGSPFGPVVQLLLLTGQRRDEVAGMRKAELSHDRATWTLPAARSKNKREHVVPLSAAARAIIEAEPAVESEAGLIFTTTGRTPVSGFSKAKEALDAAMLAQMQADIQERGKDPASAAIEPWRLHDLRRTVASGMARLGVNLPVIEKVLNHASGSFAGIVGVYQHHDFDREKRQALARWAEEVDRIVTGRSAKVMRLRGQP